jgi:hypothetical protein
MTSGYGPRDIDVEGASTWHVAIDLQHWPNNCGDPVYAILPGTVTLSSDLWLSIRHPDGFIVSYLHMYKSQRLVNVGDQVRPASRSASPATSRPPAAATWISASTRTAPPTRLSRHCRMPPTSAPPRCTPAT